MTTHRLAAAPDTVRIGTMDGTFPAVLTVASGDTVMMQCLTHGTVRPAPESGLTVPPAMEAIAAAKLPRMGVHCLTGPVAIEGAEPGDMLEVQIERIELGADWGHCGFRPLMGSLPEDFPVGFTSVIPIDKARKTCRLPWGPELACEPFFGIMAVAPPLNYGSVSSREPREHGGNMDNRELQQGSTLFLPVWVAGGRFSAGDGHGVQGDGECCINGLETCLDGTFTFVLHKGGGAASPMLRFPRAETPTHFISMGMGPDLDQAMKQALREMIAFIVARTGWTPSQAYATCSLAVDFHVTQNVNGEKGVHGMLKKGLLF